MGVIYVVIAWLVGLSFGAISSAPLWLWLALAGICLAGLLFYRSNRPVRLPFFVLIGLSLGAARYTGAIPNLSTPDHIAFYTGKGEVELTGVIATEPAIYETATNLTLRVESVQPAGERKYPVSGNVLLRGARYPEFEYGDRLVVVGDLVQPLDNPETGYREYLANQRIYSEIRASETLRVGENEGNPIYRAIYKLKDKARQTIMRSLPDPQSALLVGILLGDESGLSVGLEEQFRITGMTHIIAISGFNIAILAGIMLGISRPLLGRRWSAWLVLLGITVYTVLVGADASVVRAAIMGGLLVISTQLLGRPTFAPAGLFSAAFVMTLVDPFILKDIGFQLSFAATLGLMLYVGPWGKWLQHHVKWLAEEQPGSWLMRMLSDVVLATVAAMLLTLPLILYHFGRLSLISPVANLLILPAQPGVMIWGGLATLVGMVFPEVGQLFAWVAWLFLSYTISLVRFLAAIPHASVPIRISLLALVGIYIVIFLANWLDTGHEEQRISLKLQIKSKVKPGIVLTIVTAAAAILLAWTQTQPDGYLTVTFFDVGQGDATLIETPTGRQILVDGGAYPTLLKDLLGQEIPFWDRQIDIVVATHPDGDHISGLPDLFDRYDVDRLITSGQTGAGQTYEALLTTARSKGTTINQTEAGEVIYIGDGVRLEILNPATNKSGVDEQNANDSSVSMKLSFGDFSLLLTGDAGQEAELAMLRRGQDLRSIVYKAGHHGASSSSSAIFLEQVHPDYIIVSAGAGNRYGHPSPELFRRAANIGAAVLRTDELGTITVVSNGRTMRWESKG